VEPLGVDVDAAPFYNPRYFGQFGPRVGHLQWDHVYDWWQP
jgi:hypothetical protein